MQSTINKDNGVLTIAVEGRLDTVTSAELKAKLDEIGFEDVDIDFDFSGVAYISSAGLRLVVALQKQALEGGKTLVIRNINKVVAEVFKVSGFDKALHIV
jgi:anti-sigma B factor antagonist